MANEDLPAFPKAKAVSGNEDLPSFSAPPVAAAPESAQQFDLGATVNEYITQPAMAQFEQAKADMEKQRANTIAGTQNRAIGLIAPAAGAAAGFAGGFSDIANLIPGHKPVDQQAALEQNQIMQAAKEQYPASYGAGQAGGYLIPGLTAAAGAGAFAGAVPQLGALGATLAGAAARIPSVLRGALTIGAGNLAYGGVQGSSAAAQKSGKSGLDVGAAIEGAMEQAKQGAWMMPVFGGIHAIPRVLSAFRDMKMNAAAEKMKVEQEAQAKEQQLQDKRQEQARKRTAAEQQILMDEQEAAHNAELKAIEADNKAEVARVNREHTLKRMNAKISAVAEEKAKQKEEQKAAHEAAKANVEAETQRKLEELHTKRAMVLRGGLTVEDTEAAQAQYEKAAQARADRVAAEAQALEEQKAAHEAARVKYEDEKLAERDAARKAGRAEARKAGALPNEPTGQDITTNFRRGRNVRRNPELAGEGGGTPQEILEGLIDIAEEMGDEVATKVGEDAKGVLEQLRSSVPRPGKMTTLNMEFFPGLVDALMKVLPLYAEMVKNGENPLDTTYLMRLTMTQRVNQAYEQFAPTLSRLQKIAQSNLAGSADDMAEQHKMLMFGKVGLAQFDVDPFNTAEKRSLLAQAMKKGVTDNAIRGNAEYGVWSDAQKEYVIKLRAAKREWASVIKPHREFLEKLLEKAGTPVEEQGKGLRSLLGLNRMARIMDDDIRAAEPEYRPRAESIPNDVLQMMSQGTFGSLFLGRLVTHELHAGEGLVAGSAMENPVAFLRAGVEAASDPKWQRYNHGFAGPGAFFEVGTKMDNPVGNWFEKQQQKVFGKMWDAVNNDPNRGEMLSPSTTVDVISGKAFEDAKNYALRVQACRIAANELKWPGGTEGLRDDIIAVGEGRTQPTSQLFKAVMMQEEFLNRTTGYSPMLWTNASPMQRHGANWIAMFMTARANQANFAQSLLKDFAEGISNKDPKVVALAARRFAYFLVVLQQLGSANWMEKSIEKAWANINPVVLNEMRVMSKKYSILSAALHTDMHHLQYSLTPFLYAGESLPELAKERLTGFGEVPGKLKAFMAGKDTNAWKSASNIVGTLALVDISNFAGVLGTSVVLDDIHKLYEGLATHEHKVSVFRENTIFGAGTKAGEDVIKNYNLGDALHDIFVAGYSDKELKIREHILENADLKSWLREHDEVAYNQAMKAYAVRLGKEKAFERKIGALGAAEYQLMQQEGATGKPTEYLSVSRRQIKADSDELKQMEEAAKKAAGEPDWEKLVKRAMSGQKLPYNKLYGADGEPLI